MINKKKILALLSVLFLAMFFLQSSLVSYGGNYNNYTVKVDLTGYYGKAYQILFENAEIVSAYKLESDGEKNTVFIPNEYNNMYLSENTLSSGSVQDQPIYVNVRTNMDIESENQIKFTLNDGSKAKPFDFSKMKLDDGNIALTETIDDLNNSIYTKVFLQEGKEYFIEGQASGLHVEDESGEIIYQRGTNKNTRSLGVIIKPEKTGIHYIVGSGDEDGVMVHRIQFFQLGVTNISLRPKKLNESYKKVLGVNTSNSAGIHATLNLDAETTNFTKHFSGETMMEYYGGTQSTSNSNFIDSSPDFDDYSRYEKYFELTPKGKTFSISYKQKSSLYDESPSNKISLTAIKNENPKVGTASKKIVQELKSEDREVSEMGDPVDAFRGNFVDRKTLLSYSGDNALSFDVNYDSIANDSNSLASGFTHNFETKLIRKNDELSILWNPNSITHFKKENDVWHPIKEKDEYLLTENDSGYKITEGENEYTFSVDGKIISQESKKGQKISYMYTNGVLTNVENQRGQKFEFEHTSDKLTRVTDLDGRSVQFIYDSSLNELKKIVYPNQKELVLSYQYDTETSTSSPKIQKMTFDGKTLVDNHYNLLGAVDYQYDGNGNKTEFIYDEWSNQNEITTTLINPDGTRISKTHNEKGEVIREKNERGYELTFNYDSKGNKIEETDFKGNVIQYQYDENNNVVKTINPDGSFILNEYNDECLIVKTTDVDGLDMIYSYDSNQRLVKMTDKEGMVTSFEYDSLGNVIKQMTGTKVLERNYDVSGNLIKVKLPDGKESLHEYDILGRQVSTTLPGGEKLETVYDVMNNVLKQTNPDKTSISYEYDAFGKKVKEYDQMGRLTSYTYDVNGNLKSETRGLRGVLYQYDTMNRLISKSYKNMSGVDLITYDNAGNIVETSDENGVTITRTYDENNQVLTETTEENTTSFEYDVMGRVIKSVDPEGQSDTYEYNDAGLLSKTTSPSGNTTQYHYDKMGRQTKVIDPMGNEYQTIYNERGERIKEINPLGYETRYRYDANGRLIEASNALGETSTMVYNQLGQLMEQRNARNEVVAKMGYDASGRVVSLIDGNNNESKMVYDSVGNLIESYNAEGNLISKNEFNEFNELVKTTDALNATTSFEYNLRGFQTKETDALGNSTSYSYLDNGQLSTSKNSNGTVAYNYYDEKGRLSQNKIGSFTNNYSYNGNDQIVLETMPGGNTLEYKYNPEGLMEERKNGRGDLSNYEYDKNGNLIKEITEEGTIIRTYDVLNREIKSESPSGIIERKYDALNRVIEKIQNGKRIGYEYDDRGNLVLMTYPDGKEVSYTYDVMGNLLTVKDWKNNVTTYSYNKNNQLLKTIHSNGVVEEREYNIGGQLKSVKSLKDDVLITHFTYEYDLNGNITKEVDVKNSKNNLYTYDKLGRLTNANDNSYTYSPTGNITSYQITQNGQSVARTMNYNADNQLSKVDGLATSMDNDRNLLKYKLNGKTYVATYDSQNKLIQAGNQYFQYDSEGNRIGIRKTNGSGVTTSEVSIVVDNDSNRLSRNLVESSADGDIYYVYGHGLISEHKGENVNTYHFDYRGSTVAMTNQLGTVIGEAEYDEYGVVLKSTIVTRYMYNGQYGIENDGDGLYYMRTRFYNVDLKKFMNRDVVMGNIQDSQSLNRYAYVNGNPVNFTDPFGMARETVENTQAQSQGIGGANSETLHFVLDMIGLFPVVGELADAANVLLYVSEGNYKMAMVSAAAMVPLIGNLATVGKIGSKVVGKIGKAKDAVVKTVSSGWGWIKKTAGKVGNVAKNIVKSDKARAVGGFLKERLGNSRGSNTINAALFGIPELAKRYADLVNSNKKWVWKKDFPEVKGEKMKKEIKAKAVEDNLIPNVPYKGNTKYADFEKAGVVEETYYLPQDLYKASDRKQFQYLDELRGGKAEGKTWHHNEESPGRMDLVPFGIHNVTHHYGGRSKGNWAHGKR